MFSFYMINNNNNNINNNNNNNNTLKLDVPYFNGANECNF